MSTRHGHFRLVLLVLFAAVLAATAATPGAQSNEIQFIFTSDAHYGLTRSAFLGGTDVNAHIVNAAMVAKMNALPSAKLPHDGGLRAGQPVGAIDFLVESGDIANRSEVLGSGAIQSASASWAQFSADYIRGITVTDHSGHTEPIFIVPGNHDATNAVGYYRPMTPLVDATSMVEIYNRMMAPATPKTTATYDYNRDKVLASRDLGGVHFIFVTVWPDSMARAWMENDLTKVGSTTPIIIFAHDQPDAEAKHFRNPNGRHDINNRDRFENLLADEFKDGRSVAGSSTIEQSQLEDLVRLHPNIAAYFHGNSNWNQFYDWSGPHHTIALHVFRVDSPMKGAISAKDETRLSFQLATIDPASHAMTVRECLWDPDPRNRSPAVAWGASTTVSLTPGWALAATR